MAREARELPPQHLPKLEPLFRHLLPEEAGVRRPAVLAHQALRQHIRRVLHEPGERRVAARQTALDPALQRQQMDPQDPLTDLHA